MRPVLVAVVLGTVLSESRAQTFVVDQANGFGANFTSLSAAAASVPDGAVLLVRPGSYAGFSITQKGLAVFGGPGVLVTSTIAVTHTAPHQHFVLRGVSWPAPTSSAPCLQVIACAGPVVLETLAMTGWPASAPVEPNALAAGGCSQLVLRESSLGGLVSVVGTVASIERCSLTGTGGSGFLVPSQTTPGLSAESSTVQVVGSTVRGGDGYGSGPGGSLAASDAIRLLNNSAVRLLGSTVIAGTDGGGPRYAVGGYSSDVRVDVQTLLNGVIQPFNGITSHVLPKPRLTTFGAALGGSVQATVATEAGDLVLLVVGLPGAPTLVPGFEDAFWLDPAAHLVHAIGVQQPGAPITGRIAVPGAAGLRGLHLVWHAACFGPTTQQQATNPAISLIR